jgi:hypothetical protein
LIQFKGRILKKLAVIGLAVAGLVVSLLLGATSVSWAADRLPITVVPTKACGTVTLTFTNPNTDVSKTHGFRWNAVAGKVSTADGARTGLVTVPPGKTVKETIRFAEDEFSGEAAVTVALAFGPDSDIQPRIADIYPVDTDCAPPVTTTPVPTTTPVAPTTPPVPSDEPDPSTTPAPPTSDDLAPAENDDDGLNPGPIVDSVVTPVGGVETGGGPA